MGTWHRRRALLLAMMAVGFAWLAPNGAGGAAPLAKPLVTGDWSAPVSDRDGYALRGRLVLEEKPPTGGLREVVVYVELRDATESVGRPQSLYCEMSPSDFRPEHKGGLRCELRDAQGRAVPSAPFAFGGAVPLSEWLTLPSDGLLRARATPFGIRREKALAIAPGLANLWVIPDGDPETYTLSGTFTIAPPEEQAAKQSGHVWRGTLELPALRLTNRP